MRGRGGQGVGLEGEKLSGACGVEDGSMAADIADYGLEMRTQEHLKSVARLLLLSTEIGGRTRQTQVVVACQDEHVVWDIPTLRTCDLPLLPFVLGIHSIH